MDKRMVLDSIMGLCLKENDRSIDMYIADRKGNTYPITHVFLGGSGVLYATNGTALVALEELDDNTLKLYLSQIEKISHKPNNPSQPFRVNYQQR